MRLYADGLDGIMQHIRNGRVGIRRGILYKNHDAHIVWTHISAGTIKLYSSLAECLLESTRQSLATCVHHRMDRYSAACEWGEEFCNHVHLSIAERRRGLHLLRHPLLLLGHSLRKLGSLLILCGEFSFSLLLLPFMFTEFNLQLEIGLFGIFGFFVRSCGVRESFICVLVGLCNFGVSGGFVRSQIHVF